MHIFQSGLLNTRRDLSGLSGGVRLGCLAICLVPIVPMAVDAADWRVVGLNDAAILEAPEIRFEDDGAFSGTTGCNSFQGQARFDGDALIVDGPVATTRMACPGEALSRQEDRIIALFEGRIAVAFDPLRDALRLGSGDIVLDLRRRPDPDMTLPDLPKTHAGLERPSGEPPYLSPFGLADDMPIHAAPDTTSDVVGGAFSGQVLRNEGCEGDWCRVTTLDAAVSGWGERQYLETSASTLRAGQGVFDAVGAVPCAKGKGAPMTICGMGVARDGGGSATVIVTKSDGVPRALYFTEGAFVGSDTSEAGGGFESSATRVSDLTFINVDDERYEIPDAVVFGG